MVLISSEIYNFLAITLSFGDNVLYNVFLTAPASATSLRFFRSIGTVFYFQYLIYLHLTIS